MSGETAGLSLRFDEIGAWSEIKLEILDKYARAYTSILSKQKLRYFYIDGFAGSGVHLSRESRQLVAGSPLNALAIEPRFHEYFLVDLDGDKIEQLRHLVSVERRPHVHLIAGDCNEVLLGDVFPNVRYEDYRRALCLLDPYGLHLDWRVIATAGRMKSIEIFLNFPIMDANRNALWTQPDRAGADGQMRMTAFWGDESWRSIAYAQQGSLLGAPEGIKLGNSEVVRAFRERLRSVAGFSHVPEPLPMRNSTNAVVYYLFFASQRPVAGKIVDDIMARYR